MARRVVVEILGDSSQLEKTFRRSARSASEFNRDISRAGRGAISAAVSFRGLGRAMAFSSAQFLGGAGIVFALKSTVDAAMESQRVLGQTRNAVKRSGQSWGQWGEIIQKAALAQSNLSGFDDEQLLGTFSNLVRRTEDVNKALRLNALAADVARGRNIKLEAATQLVLKASMGNAGALRRVGIAARKNASSVELLDLLQRRFAGSAAEYGRTAVGAQDRFRVALQNTQEMIGAALLPALTTYLNAGADWLSQTENQKRLQDDVTKAVEATTTALGLLADAFGIAADAADKYKQVADKLGKLPGPVGEALKVLLLPGYGLAKTIRALAKKGGPTMVGGSVFHLPPGQRQGLPAGGLAGLDPDTTRRLSAAARAARRNQWFDATLARQLDRLQDIGLRKQLVGLRRIAGEIRARIAITKDVTRRLNLEDQLVSVYRQQRAVQEQITQQIQTQNEKLKERAEAIKSAILERLQRRQTDVENKRALRDAQEQLRQAKILGGRLGIRQARENLADVLARMQYTQAERGRPRLRGGVFTLGAITINVHGVTDPEKVAQIVVDTIERKRRHGTTQARGPYAGRH